VDQIPVGTRFSTPIQTGPMDKLASYTKGTVSVPLVKRVGRGFDHPSPSSTEVKKGVELYISSCLRSFVACVGWILPLPQSFSAKITCRMVAADKWNLNDSHIKNVIK